MKRANIALLVSVVAGLIALLSLLQSYRLFERIQIVSLAASKQSVVETMHQAWLNASELADETRLLLRHEDDPDVRERLALIMHSALNLATDFESRQAEVQALPFHTSREVLIAMEELRSLSLARERELQVLLTNVQELRRVKTARSPARG